MLDPQIKKQFGSWTAFASFNGQLILNKKAMEDLIKALQILLKYANDDRKPIHCEHDQLYIGCGIEKEMVSNEDIKLLDELGIFWSDSDEEFMSFRFGSC